MSSLRSKKIEWIARVRGKFEKVTLGRCHGRPVAHLVRHGRRLATFVPSAAQLQKIRRGAGTLNITEGAVMRAHVQCGSAGW